MSEFEPCEARMHDPEDGITLGCLLDASNGHHPEGGTVHQNGGHHWSALRNLAAVRCTSLISGDALAPVWRCVENAGHYPTSIHMKTGYMPKAWTNEMSLNPPPVKPVRDPHRQDRIMDEVEKVTAIWRGLGPMGRRMLNEHVGHELYRALHAMAIEVEERVPLPGIEPDEDDWTVNGAPGVSGCGFGPPVEVEVGYPAEMRVKDLERMLDVRHDRREALHHARKTWKVTTVLSPEEQAHQVITIARAFERYLTDGTGRKPDLEPVVPMTPDLHATNAGRHAVMNAAMTWVERAHLRNASGLENWRNWANDHDVHLINAVLRYRGMPPIESEKP